MCKLGGNLQQRGEKKKKKTLFLQSQRTEASFSGLMEIIIMRSASYLCIRGWVRDFNDSFPDLSLLSLSILKSDDEVSQIKSRSGIWSDSFTNKLPWRRLSLFLAAVRFFFFFCDYGLCWANASLEPAACRNCPIYLFCFFTLSAFTQFSKRPPRFHLASHFILLFFAADEKIAGGIGRAHVILITCQSSDLSPGFQTVSALID